MLKLVMEKRYARILYFEPKSRTHLETSQVEGKAVALINCRVKPGKVDSLLEVITSSNTEVEISPKKIKLDPTLQESAMATSLDKVHTISVNQLINVSE